MGKGKPTLGESLEQFRGMSRNGKIAFVAFVVILCGAFAVAVANKNERSTVTDRTSTFSEDLRRALAYDACTRAVEARLRAPATAQFPDEDDATYLAAGPDQYVIGSHVDAENGFGALLRNLWTCTATTTDGGDTWRASDAELVG